MANDEPRAVVIEHRGREYQVHVAPRPGDESEEPKPHVHVQDLRGGPGRVLPREHPFVEELTRHHATVRELGAESTAAKERREQRAAEEQAALAREGSSGEPDVRGPWGA
jgi:hypothetical protein